MAEETLTKEEMTNIALCMNALAEIYGIVPADDAYRAYQYWYSAHTSLGDFAGTVYSAAQSGRFAFRIWEAKDVDYIVHSTLAEDNESFKHGDGHHYSMAEYRSHLLEQHSMIAMKEFDGEPSKAGVLNWKMQQPGIQKLITHLTLIGPDAEEARAIAEMTVRELLCVSLVAYDQEGARLLLNAHGYMAHNKIEDPTMPLIAQAMDELPCWEYNGWSPREHRNHEDAGTGGFKAPIEVKPEDQGE